MWSLHKLRRSDTTSLGTFPKYCMFAIVFMRRFMVIYETPNLWCLLKLLVWTWSKIAQVFIQNGLRCTYVTRFIMSAWFKFNLSINMHQKPVICALFFLCVPFSQLYLCRLGEIFQDSFTSVQSVVIQHSSAPTRYQSVLLIFTLLPHFCSFLW